VTTKYREGTMEITEYSAATEG